MNKHTDDLKAACDEHQLGKDGRPIAIVGEAMIIHGSATARDDADLLILGEIHGPVQARGAVVITKGAKVHGGVQASRLCVLGELDATASKDGSADVVVDGLLDVRSTGVVRAASINYVQLQSESGGRLSGMINFTERAASAVEAPAVVARASDTDQKRTEEAAAPSADAKSDSQTPDSGSESAGVTRPAWDAPQDLIESPRVPNLRHLPKLDGTYGGPRGG
jgi:cytoskeletal protein CcmA (bactofilin family)